MDFMHAHPNPYEGLAVPDGSAIPSMFPWSEAFDWADDADDTEVLLGQDAEGPSYVDLETESPHVLVNAPTGAGKSGVARSIGVQSMRHGDLVVVLDRKMHSQRWARQLAPLVHYSDTLPDIGGSLVSLGMELHRRNMVVRDFEGAVEDAPVGPPITVLFEEMSATLNALKELDKRTPNGGYRAMDALMDVVLMGRAAKIRVVGFAQLASYRSGMTADMLENFGVRVLMDYSDKAWKWLAADCGRYQVAPLGKGRAMVVKGHVARETQLLYIPEEEAAGLVLLSVEAQSRVRELCRGGRIPRQWRQAIGS